MTQGEQILGQLQRYDDDKRIDKMPLIMDEPQISNEHNEDELLNSQIELMQLSRSPGTIMNTINTPTTITNNNSKHIKHYTSLKIKASKPKYFPPLNFGIIDSDLYRCGHPQIINYPFLKSLKLKTIIYIGDKTNNWEYYKWIKEEGIQFIHLPIKIELNDKSVKDFKYLLSIIKMNDNYPILIHSNKGKHRVGFIVALIRKNLQNWLLAPIYDEYNKYAKFGKEDNIELQFIELFDASMA